MRPQTMLRARSRAVILAATAAFAAALTAAPAQAAPTLDGFKVIEKVMASADPHAAYARLSPVEKAAFTAASTPTETLTVTDIPAADNRTGIMIGSVQEAISVRAWGCWARRLETTGKALGVTVYRGAHTNTTCVQNGQVYSVQAHDVTSSTHAPFWSVAREAVTDTMNVYWEGRSRSQHFFNFAFDGAGGQKQPCNQIRLNADMYHYAESASCSLST